MPLEKYWSSMDPKKSEIFDKLGKAVVRGEKIPELETLTPYDAEVAEVWCVMHKLSDLQKLLEE